MELEGKVKLVGETKTFGNNGFRKREDGGAVSNFI
jgi:hypothetical protein